MVGRFFVNASRSCFGITSRNAVFGMAPRHPLPNRLRVSCLPCSVAEFLHKLVGARHNLALAQKRSFGQRRQSDATYRCRAAYKLLGEVDIVKSSALKPPQETDEFTFVAKRLMTH